MKRFWLTTRASTRPTPLNLGVGVTAKSEADAMQIAHERFGDQLEVEGVAMIADMAEIDQAHVAPNIGDHMVRGVWFPRQT